MFLFHNIASLIGNDSAIKPSSSLSAVVASPWWQPEMVGFSPKGSQVFIQS